MNKLVVGFCSFVAGSIGWWLGDQLGGLFPAFLVSMVGTGVGVYAGKRVIAQWDI